MFNTHTYICSICKRNSLEISRFGIQEPLYIALIDDYLCTENLKPLTMSLRFQSSLTKNNFEFIASINIPFANHYNLVLHNPFLTPQLRSEGYFMHDGLGSGVIEKIFENEAEKSKMYNSI